MRHALDSIVPECLIPTGSSLVYPGAPKVDETMCKMAGVTMGKSQGRGSSDTSTGLRSGGEEGFCISGVMRNTA